MGTGIWWGWNTESLPLQTEISARLLPSPRWRWRWRWWRLLLLLVLLVLLLMMLLLWLWLSLRSRSWPLLVAIVVLVAATVGQKLARSSQICSNQIWERRNRQLCSLMPSDSHEAFLQLFDDSDIPWCLLAYLIHFLIWCKNFSISRRQIRPYFLHLAGAHFVPLACGHSYYPGGEPFYVMCIYIYIYQYLSIYLHIYIYIYDIYAYIYV